MKKFLTICTVLACMLSTILFAIPVSAAETPPPAHHNCTQCSIISKEKNAELLQLLNHPDVIKTSDSIYIPTTLISIPELDKVSQERSWIEVLKVIIEGTYLACQTIYYISGGFDPCMWVRNQLANLSNGTYIVYAQKVSGKDPNCVPPHSYACNTGYYYKFTYKKVA